MRYSTQYYSDMLLRKDTAQQRFAKIGANVTLYGPRVVGVRDCAVLVTGYKGGREANGQGPRRAV